MTETSVIIALVAVVVLFALLAFGMWIGLALAISGVLALALFRSYTPGPILAQILWNSLNSFTLSAVPLFILMGELLLRSRISDSLFKGLAPWFERVPGRLLHVNIVACTIFAAISGSSAATCATIGSVTFPEYEKRGYDIRLPAGSLAAAGTLGLLIPPSISMILYGSLTDVSVGQLFMGGFLPGFLVAGLFSAYIAVEASRNRDLAPSSNVGGFKEALRALPLLLPSFVLIGVVLGTIYLGIATPTEAAAVGVVGALVVSALSRTLTWRAFWDSTRAAVMTTCMIFFIMMGASFMATAAGYLRIAGTLAAAVAAWGVSPYVVLGLLVLVYLVLGCFFDGVSMLVMTLPVVYPVVVTELGFNPVWFGIFLVLLIQIANITPPVGFNLYIVQGLTGLDPLLVLRYSMPFFMLLLLGILIITIWPELVLFLPNQMV